jgi:hypothetical protein
MKRAQLEALPLEELYRLALAHGIAEAPGLPRAVLIDRLVGEHGPSPHHHPSEHGRGESARERSRERGFEEHLAKAAVSAGKPGAEGGGNHGVPVEGRGRRSAAGIPSGVAPDRPQEHDTESMARLYFEQGDVTRALELYHELLRIRPDDAELRAAISRAEHALAALAGMEGRAQAPRDAGEKHGPRPDERRAPGEPLGMLDLAEPPDAYGVDECEVLFKDPHTLFLYWEVTDAGLQTARRGLGDEAGAAKLVVRLLSQRDRPGEKGPERESRDHALDWNHGRRYFPSPRPGARVRAAVGLLTPSGLFAAIAQSSLVRVPPSEPAPTYAVEWMEVQPALTRGLEREPVVLPAHGSPAPTAPLDEAAQRSASAQRAFAPGGGSEMNQPQGSSPHGHPTSPWRWRPGSQS